MHRTKEQSYDHLFVLRNHFGKCFGGSHPFIKEGTQQIVNNASVDNLIYENDASSDFFTIEAIWVQIASPYVEDVKVGNVL